MSESTEPTIPFQCAFVSERHGIRCQLNRHHVDSLNVDNHPHRAWGEDGFPILKVYS